MRTRSGRGLCHHGVPSCVGLLSANEQVGPRPWHREGQRWGPPDGQLNHTGFPSMSPSGLRNLAGSCWDALIFRCLVISGNGSALPMLLPLSFLILSCCWALPSSPILLSQLGFSIPGAFSYFAPLMNAEYLTFLFIYFVRGARAFSSYQ